MDGAACRALVAMRPIYNDCISIRLAGLGSREINGEHRAASKHCRVEGWREVVCPVGLVWAPQLALSALGPWKDRLSLLCGTS